MSLLGEDMFILKLRRAIMVGIIGLGLAAQADAQLMATYLFTGSSAGSDFGEDVDSAGDVNGDGFDDVIIGSSGDDTSFVNAGKAVVYSGFDGSVLHTFLGAASGSYLGYAVSGADDINGDGFDDVMVSDYPAGASATPGRVTIYSGFDGSVLAAHFGTMTGEVFGYAIARAGDVDNDGAPDIIVGAPFNALLGFYTGRAYVISGATGLTLYTFTGVAPGGYLGRSVDGAGDVNGDGFDDVIVGSPVAMNAAGTLTGNAQIFSGIDGSLIKKIDGPGASGRFGHSVSSAGDIDQDGYSDYIIGSPFFGQFPLNRRGAAYVYSGQTGQLLHTIMGANSSDNLGEDVSDCGDVDGDGFPDFVIVKAAQFSGAQPEALLYSGKSISLLVSLTGTPGTGTNVVVNGAGDVNGDGFDDLVVGRPTHLGTGTARTLVAQTLAVLNYSDDDRSTGLHLEWNPLSGNINSLSGSLVGSGATPNALGFYGVSLAPAELQIFGFPLLIAVDQTLNLIETGTFTFDAMGSFVAPNISRQHPTIVGSLIHVQWFEVSPNLASSNGIRLTMEM